MKNRIKFKIINIVFKLKAMYYININKNRGIMPIKSTQRRIGKTEFMVKYAKRHDYTVVISNYMRVRELKQKYDYNKISTVNEIREKGLRPRNIMIDEPVSSENIERIMYETRHKIILAYKTLLLQ